jgi:hypothetical protein
MQWIVDHWFELATTALLAVIAVNTFDSNWNNSTIVEQLNEIIRSFSSRVRRRSGPREASSVGSGHGPESVAVHDPAQTGRQPGRPNHPRG